MLFVRASPRSRSLALALAVGTTLALGALTRDAAAQKAGLLVTPTPPVPALGAASSNVPAKCKAPTQAQCVDGNWYKTDPCAKDPATSKAMLDACTAILLDDWRKRAGSPRPTLFPMGAPNSVIPVLPPARRVERGKNVTAQPHATLTGQRRRYGGVTPRGAYGGVVTVPASGLNPRAFRAGGGSLTGLQMAAASPDVGRVEADLEAFRGPGLVTTDPGLNMKAETLFGRLSARPSYMTSGPGVTSCEEYATKRYGDYPLFSLAAKRLGRNYRQIYNLAMDPSSPFFVNKILNQTGTSVQAPKQIQDLHPGYHGWGQNTPVLYLNAFYAVKPTFLDTVSLPGVSNVDKDRIKALVAARWNNSGPVKVSATDGSQLGVHKHAKTRFDTVYGNPHDDELADIAKRTGTYQTLASQRAALLVGYACLNANDPCHKCTEDPGQGLSGGQSLPPVFQKIKDRVSGAPVINPSDVSALFATGNPAQRYKALVALSDVATLMPELEGARRGGGAVQSGGAKQKAAPLAQLKSGGSGVTSANACIAGLLTQKQQVDAVLNDIEKTMAKLLVNELRFGDRGCLANPQTSPQTVNMCDWSYELFGSTVTSLFDGEVERSFQECRVEVANALQASPTSPGSNLATPASMGFRAILQNPNRQELVYPCVRREDFTVNAPKAAEFMNLSGHPMGRICEGYLQNATLSAMQAAIADDIRGLEWTPGEGKIGDTEEDTFSIGERSSLGAYFTYGTGWEVKKGGSQSADPLSTCKYDGKASSKIEAGIYFFDSDLKLFTLDGSGESKGRTAKVSAYYLDVDTFQMKPFSNATKGQTVSLGASEVYSAPLAQPPVYLGGDEVSFWVWIGPVPVHIVFGAFATAGVDYEFAGTSGNNCANLEAPSNFRLTSVVEPWVRADAYADASVDVLVASAGIRLDLLLLRLGIPFGVDIANREGKSWRFHNGGRISIDLLTGRVSVYVDVGAPPLEASYDATIMSWDGFHTDIGVWGVDKTIPGASIRTALAPFVQPDQAKCKCTAAGQGAFCCSLFECAGNNPVCSAGAKTIDNKRYLCTFNQADYTRIHNDLVKKNGGPGDGLQCQQFVR